MRHVLVALLGALVALPGAALATHMGQYANDPLERDLQGQVAEPDGVVTSVLGPRVANCVVELPSRDGFEGRCQGEPRGTGLQPDGAIAPGCTGADANSQPVRRLDGQCGLWDVGAPRPNGVWAPVAGPQLGPGRIAPPISERGMGAGAYPGRYAGPVRFLDARLDADFVQNAATGGPTWVRDYNQLLQDLAGGGMTPTPLGAPLPPAEPLQPFAGAVLPGQHYVWAWYGQWDDRNGNGVVDHCFGGCHPFDGAGINEFAWLGSCMAFEDLRVPEAISAGICIEDPNPNLDPPGMPCADPGSLLACAGTTMAIWVWPGNHHGNGMTGDMPLSQPLFSWINTGKPLNCSDPPTCDDEDLAYNGDPLLGRQDEVAADGTYHDRTGDGADDGDDTARQWSGYLGGDSTYYGDDGLLVTMVQVTGVNCAATDGATGYDLRAHAGGPGGCTFVDVDKYPTVSPFAEHLLVGDPEEPTSGLKAIGRSAWIMVRERGPGLMKTIDAVQNGALTYQLTQGSLRGKLDDQFVDPGWSREPNSPPRTVVNGLTGESLTVAEQFVGATYRSCEDFPVGDARNPTAEPDLASLEAQHRGNCNVYQDGTADPYRDYRATASGWIDITSYRGLTMNNPVTLIAPPCTFCFWSSPIDIPAYPETPTTPPDLDPPEDHTRTLP
ncbi:MAG TPA: hypothetical protein VGR28_10110, partial [Candidatus Thermoplasmatota archaeon]|nr:hypothetical protein [Candidatus Thermoplasmatota archaeon]